MASLGVGSAYVGGDYREGSLAKKYYTRDEMLDALTEAYRGGPMSDAPFYEYLIERGYDPTDILGPDEPSSEDGYSDVYLPEPIYFPTPTEEELAWMSKFGIKNYGKWAQDVINKAYADLPDLIRSVYEETYGKPDTSMFTYPDTSVFDRLGDIVKEYYDTYRSYAIPRWERDVLPQIAEQYSGPGYWSTSRAGAISKALTDFEEELAMQEASKYADARKEGLLRGAEEKLNVDRAKMAYLANLASAATTGKAQALSSAYGGRADALASLLSNEPAITSAVTQLSRKFVEPVINPEFVALADWYSTLLGQQPFNTVAYNNNPYGNWASILSSVGSSLGSYWGSRNNNQQPTGGTTVNYNYYGTPTEGGYNTNYYDAYNNPYVYSNSYVGSGSGSSIYSYPMLQSGEQPKLIQKSAEARRYYPY